MIVVVSPSTLSITIALLACLLLALTFSSLHLKDNLPSAADDGIKAAFVILVGPSTATENRTRGLELALHTLWFNYLQAHPQPVYLFVGDDVPPGQYTPEVIKAIAPEGMVAEAFQVPGFTRPPDNMRTVVLHHIVAGGKYPGYHNMCRWNFMGLIQHPKIRNLDYYCRMDTDSRIRTKIDYDFFETMEGNGYHYGYIMSSTEALGVSVGLWNFIEDYVNTHLRPVKNRLEANYFKGNLSIGLKAEVRWQMVKNEFECLHVQRFTEPDVVQFTEAIDATHGIYEHRWGDSPLRWLELMLFLNIANETVKFRFDYAQDHANAWQPPEEWGISRPKVDEASQ